MVTDNLGSNLGNSCCLYLGSSLTSLCFIWRNQKGIDTSSHYHIYPFTCIQVHMLYFSAIATAELSMLLQKARSSTGVTRACPTLLLKNFPSPASLMLPSDLIFPITVTKLVTSPALTPLSSPGTALILSFYR